MKCKYSSLVVSLGAVPYVIAADVMTDVSGEVPSYQQSPERLKKTINQAITNFEQTPRKHWSFRITRYENEEGDVTSSIEQYDPVLQEGKEWSLLQLNGEQPNEKAQRDFVEAKRKRSKENGEHSYSIKLGEMIQTDSLVFHAEDAENLEAKFRVKLSQLGEDATKNLLGTLSYNKRQAYIESIEIVNTDEFSPMFSAKITDFNLSLSFFKIDNAVLPHQQALSMKGSFAFFTEIDEESLDTFSDYQYRND